MSAELQRALFADVEAGLRVLVVRDGVPLTDEQISERTTNIVAALVGNYSIVPFEPLGAPPNWDTPLIGPSPPHMYKCHCGQRPGEFPIADIKPITLRTERTPGVVPRHSWSCKCSTCFDAKQKERA